ncbi:hypothetical protein BDN71DRAFT_24805 [Pleurotus eryngii]|uniref:Uncharacterized protein n=1 Tax=Pleurotus eryngii TaxID=5323 RepID=A0A9P6A8U1_PLEER|nr:hypothetical protein BDN71DRAFT_24805 [Pleurotus eryngii]
MLGKILQTNDSVPYVNRNPDSASLGSVLFAPRRPSDALFETNIDVLPAPAGILDDATRNHYLDHPPSHAVDGRTDTAFCPISGAQKGEYLLLDTINGISQHQNTSLVFLVDPLGCVALRSSTFEGSADGMTWGSLRPSHLICDPEHQFISAETPKVSTRATLMANVDLLWCLYEIWIDEGSAVYQ